MSHHEWVANMIERKRDTFIRLSDQIWELAELRFEEHRSVDLQCDVLLEEGFQIERGVGGIETAFIASYGSGQPIVALLGEYDALPGLSQKGGVATREPIAQGGSGHGCGHNLLGAGSLAAAVALGHYMEAYGLSGTVRYYGCPAEEGGGGKAFMARAGLFNDVDFALAWHPDDTPAIHSYDILATIQVYFRFLGRSSHAAWTPHLGRSGLDAVELMNVGGNYLREHLIPDARIHYAVTNAGGLSPNVVQEEAEVLYMIRAPQLDQIKEIYERVCNIARGAALMTETKLEIVFDAGFSNMIHNTTLDRVMYDNLLKLGIPSYDEQELQFARDIRATFTEAERNHCRHPEMRGKDLADGIPPYRPKAGMLHASNDVGDVSWIVPTTNLRSATRAIGTSPHSWQAVAQGMTSFAHKGMLHAAKVLAATAIDVLRQPQIIEQAKNELKAELGGRAYECPIPPHIGPRPVVKK